ncbi:MAG TPA: hypothetical protein VG889_09375 [Rhizomicrobium sp.]|nr:hypothetical protein [Rhizomicrobium sp.]
MRAMFMVVASVFLAVGLFGCNRQSQTAAVAPVAAITPPPAVAPPPPPVEPVLLKRHRRHGHGYAWHSHEGVSYASYSESESESYGGGDGDGGAPYPPPPPGYTQGYDDAPPPQDQAPVWTDGYGRAHYATPYDDNPAAQGGGDEHARRAPYHGWNSDCDKR